MAFVYQYNSSGGDPVVESFRVANVAVTRGSIAYFDGSGWLSNVWAAANTVLTTTLLGVADETIAASGTDGLTELAVVVTKDARYIADTTGAVEQTDIGTNVTLDSILVADEDDPVTDNTGTVKMLKVNGTAGTATQALVSLNFGTP